MRQRITFLQQPNDAVDPKSLKVTSNAISTTNLKAAREDRITFGFEELPQELYRVLKASHELHIRWVSEEWYTSIVPVVSRLSPGLHVFYTPQRNSNNSILLCPALMNVFGDIDCVSPEESFIRLPIERFSHSAAMQYYTLLPSIKDFITYLDHKLCQNTQTECLSRISLLNSASSIDIDFDTISHTLTITSFWPARIWDLDISNITPKERLEVGILSVEPAREPEELSLGGFLTVVGEDTKPSPTLFSFPARHHPTTQSFTANFIQPAGLHPTLELEISSSTPPFPADERSCSLHAHLTLPRSLFPDKYQLSDPLFLASKNLSKLHYTTTPIDLEAPSYTLSTWGSSLLIELSTSLNPQEQTDPQTSHIPLHLRYLPPSLTNDTTQIAIPHPTLFWACTSSEGTKFPINPFDRTNLGYDGLFGPRTIFYHLSPTTTSSPEGEGKLINVINVPVLDLRKSRYVEIGTAGVVMLGFLWVVWCLVDVGRRRGYRALKGVKVGKGKKEL